MDRHRTGEAEELDLAERDAQPIHKGTRQQRQEQRRYSEAETLFERLSSFAGLLYAYQQAACGKRSRPDVAAFDYALEGWLLTLRNRLRAKTYRPSPYRRFRIADPKPHVSSAAPFADRVVHHSLVRRALEQGRARPEICCYASAGVPSLRPGRCSRRRNGQRNRETERASGR